MSNSNSASPVVHSSIPRFVSIPTEAVQLSFSSNASAPCFVPTASVGTSNAQGKDNSSSKHLRLGMNYNNGICDTGNTLLGCHTKSGIQHSSPKKSQLPGNYFNLANRSRSINCSSSPLSQCEQTVSDTVTNQSHLPVSSCLLANSELPLKSCINRSKRTNSLPSSQSNLCESTSLILQSLHQQDISSNGTNLHVASSFYPNCLPNHINTKCRSSTAQLSNLTPHSKMTQPTPLSTHQLIKSQSLKFDSQQGSLFCPVYRSKGEASKSLDTVDNIDLNSSKLPRSLAQSNKTISLKMSSVDPKEECELGFDEEQLPLTVETPGSLSRSSTASLGVLTNLNDVLVENSTPGDYDYDIDAFDARLSAIDESLSPLPSFDSISCQNNEPHLDDLPASESLLANMRTSENLNHISHENAVRLDNKNVLVLNEPSNEPTASLPSINEPTEAKLCLEREILFQNEPTDPTEKQSNIHNGTLTKAKINKNGDRTQMNGVQKKSSINSSTLTRPSNLTKLSNNPKNKFSARNSQINSTLPANASARPLKSFATKRGDFTVSRKQSQQTTNSSVPSSGNVSRVSTPAFSESEFGELNSLSSTNSGVSLANAVSSKLSLQSAITNSNLTNRRLKQREIPNSTMNNNKQRSIATKSQQNGFGTSLPSSGISRSSTYTRSLNNASTSNAAAKKFEEKPSPIPKVDSKTRTILRPSPQVAEPKKAFAKPTTSYLKKTTTKAIGTPAQSTLPRRPSSVASNSSSHSVSARKPIASPITPTVRSVVTSGAKRSPTITLLSNAASSKSGQSSRRSSITGPSKSIGSVSRREENTVKTPTGNATHELGHYQALCQQQSEQLNNLKVKLRETALRSSAFLAISSHLINEYSPFDTPRLRAELAAVHKKCCILNRDYELSKESVFQKDNTIAALNGRIAEALSQAETYQNEIEGFKSKLTSTEEELLCSNEERAQLEEALEETRKELLAEKDAHLAVQSRLEQLELSCRSDKKYRDLKEKLSTYEKEVDSLNVVVEMKTQRTRHLEGEVMRIELELSNYENLKDSYQRLQRENEALQETLGMKARKNAEQSRELDNLRSELKREVNERKRFSIRNDQLEYQLNETRELLTEMSFCSDYVSTDNNPECESKVDAASQARFNALLGSEARSTLNKSVSAVHRPIGRQFVKKLFTTPSDSQLQSSRQHYQHQDPVADSKHHRLPELVLSSIGANWQVNRTASTSTITSNIAESNAANSYAHDAHHHHPNQNVQSETHSNGLSPIASPKVSNPKADLFNDFPNPPVSTPSN